MMAVSPDEKGLKTMVQWRRHFCLLDHETTDELVLRINPGGQGQMSFGNRSLKLGRKP